MSLEYSHLKDDTKIDSSINQKTSINKYHQQGAQLINPDQNIEFIFGGNNNHHQFSKANPQYDITVRKIVAIPGNPNVLGKNVSKLVNIAFAFTLEDAI